MQRLAGMMKGIQDSLADLRLSHDDSLKRIGELELRQPEKGEKGDPGERGMDGRDGKDGIDGKDAPEVTDDQIAKHVGDYLSKHPPERGEKGDPGEDGKSISLDDVRPMLSEAVDAAVKSIPVPRDGRDGKDADPVDTQAIINGVVRTLLDSEHLKTIVDMVAAGAVKSYIDENPIRDGVDGKDAPPVTDEQLAKHVSDYLSRNPPKQGEKGADGRGAAGAMIDRDGQLLLTMTDGTVERLGTVVGKDGLNGKDGADFSDVEFDYDGEREFTIKGRNGTITKRLPIPLDKGFWREGMRCEKGDIVTHQGHAYIALKETKLKPCRENGDDWRLFARGGRDGKDGKNGIDKVSPVKVGGDL